MSSSRAYPDCRTQTSLTSTIAPSSKSVIAIAHGFERKAAANFSSDRWSACFRAAPHLDLGLEREVLARDLLPTV